jgi:pyruvate dehydrogenase E2 component (dihydrolipoamide acetyltransferase)
MSEALSRGQALYARAKGSGATTIALLHGFGGDHGEWTDIQPDLARDGLVLAYDLPGHGRSLGHPAAGSVPATARAVLADLAARSLERVHVAGFSMGGAVAAMMALRSAETVASLTLLAPGGFGPEINAALLTRFAAPADTGELRACMNAMSGPGFAMPTKNVAALAAVRGVAGQRARLEHIVALIAKDGRQGEIPREMLAGLTMPVSVVWGTADPMLPFSRSQNLPAGFAFIEIAGAGHMLPVEARKAVTAAIRNNVRLAHNRM